MGSPRSLVAKHLLCQTISKELAGPGKRELQEHILEDLVRITDSEALRSRSSDLGSVYFQKQTPAGTPFAGQRDVPSRSGLPIPSSSAVAMGSLQSIRSSRPSSSFSRASDRILETSQSLPALPALSEYSSESEHYASPAVSQSNNRLAQMLLQKKKAVKVKPDATAHLRRCAIQMGVPTQSVTTYMDASKGPIQKASDPKWSTDLMLMAQRTERMLKYNARLSGSGPKLVPSERHYPKNF